MDSAIFALLIGINDYEVNPLRGCLNDVAFVEEALRWIEPGEALLHIRKLLDKDATRDAVIAAFSHFDAAAAQDTCFLYFSGHGSFIPAPDAFSIPANREHQTLVCFGDRRSAFTELVDKELAFLIWRSMCGKNKENVRFIVMTDSCHSGTVTRKFANDLRERTLATAPVTLAAEAYFGFDVVIEGVRGYQQGDDGRIRVSQSPHIHLAAATDRQTAKECLIGGMPGGVFTHSLIESLRAANGLISYAELIKRTTMGIRKLVTGQSPVLNLSSLPSATANDIFFRRLAWTAALTNYIFYDVRRGWCVDAGELDGVKRGDKVVTAGGISTVVTEVFKEESAVFAKIAFDRTERRFPVMIQRRELPGIDLRSLDAPTGALLESAWQQAGGRNFTFNMEVPPAYILTRQIDGLLLSEAKDQEPVIFFGPVEDGAAASRLISDLDLFWRWIRLQKIENRLTGIHRSDYALQVAVQNGAPAAWPAALPLPEIPVPLILEYYRNGSEVVPPALGVWVSNLGKTELWFHPVYLGHDGSIDVHSLRSFHLGPGEQAPLTVSMRRGQSDRISVGIESWYLARGYRSFTDYILVLISAGEISQALLGSYQQAGIGKRWSAATDRNSVHVRPNEEPEEFGNGDDWTSALMPLHIIYPPAH